MPAKKSVKKVVATHHHSFAGLVLGVISLLACWIPFVGTVLAFAAIITSRKPGALSVMGRILGIIALVLSLAFLGVVMFLIGVGFFAGRWF